MINTPRICIDPGVTKGHYCAIGRETIERVFIADDVVVETTWNTRRIEAYVEVPEIVFGQGVTADVIMLARAAERAVALWTASSATEGGLYAPRYLPVSQWKAGDKNGHQFAVWRALTPGEQDVLLKLAPRSTRDSVTETLSRRCVNGTKSEYGFGNAIDAAGIFLYTGGRIDKFGRSK